MYMRVCIKACSTDTVCQPSRDVPGFKNDVIRYPLGLFSVT